MIDNGDENICKINSCLAVCLRTESASLPLTGEGDHEVVERAVCNFIM